MLTSQYSATQCLKQISQKSFYGFQWKENNISQYQEKLEESKSQLIVNFRKVKQKPSLNHISQNKLFLKREPSSKLNLKKWEIKQNLIHRIEYPFIDQDLDSNDQNLFISRLMLHQNYPQDYSVMPDKKAKGKLDLYVNSEITRARQEIQRRREQQIKRVGRQRHFYKPKGQLLPSIPIKHSQFEHKNGEKDSKLNRRIPFDHGHGRKYSMPQLIPNSQERLFLF